MLPTHFPTFQQSHSLFPGRGLPLPYPSPLGQKGRSRCEEALLVAVPWPGCLHAVFRPKKIASKTAPRGILEASKILFQASWAHLGPPGGAKIAIWLLRNASFFKFAHFGARARPKRPWEGLQRPPGGPGGRFGPILGGSRGASWDQKGGVQLREN